MDKREQDAGERRQDDGERLEERIDDLEPDEGTSAEVKGGRKIGELAGSAEGG
ncbi:MAG: hypothetical protein ACRDL0_00330 [Thermoleophilaceae bacterium]